MLFLYIAFANTWIVYLRIQEDVNVTTTLPDITVRNARPVSTVTLYWELRTIVNRVLVKKAVHVSNMVKETMTVALFVYRAVRDTEVNLIFCNNFISRIYLTT